ncbi:MAG: bifunctional UDP-N-acetylglucosamine diphosphorylase/glucosamine-1-phosphate N-acetyltransferase GlmU [Alphaproteobacteria bacterium]|nr:bifunctional UDP-N-acetylglucosamine diphosphorylase/glucosamine-1-phosphate N-acetyltransferase GlmU [Alphaproteobacteria bacterium]
MTKKIACIVLAAGKGTRMKSALPKPLHPVAGAPMVQHVIAAAEGLSPERIVVVIGPDMPEMTAAVHPHQTAVQASPNGTGGAALAARDALKDFDGDILVVFGDSPLITTAALQRMIDIRRQFPAVGLTFSGMRPADPGRYGRMVLDDDGTLKKIVEFKDANTEEKAITLCNGGIVAADGAKLFGWLAQIGNDNAQGEYYLTDLPPIARKDNRQTLVVEIDAEELAGANTRVELATLEAAMQHHLREKHMLNGATLVHPDSVFFCADTVIGQDVVIEPNVFFGPGVSVADNVTIHAYSHIEGTEISKGAQIGPFARLRPGSRIGEGAKVGNFVETKNTYLGKGAKANHLTYLGDAEIGDKTNIGAGVITCNYDGFLKYKTSVGSEAFIGSNTALVAPVSIGTGAIIGAGSTITQNVPDNALGITRAPQINKDGWAPEFRQKKMKEKAKKS